MRESAGYQMILEEGQQTAMLRTLYKLGRKRFGSPSPEVEAKLKATYDIDYLDRLLDRMIDSLDQARNWDEFLQS